MLPCATPNTAAARRERFLDTLLVPEIINKVLMDSVSDSALTVEPWTSAASHSTVAKYSLTLSPIGQSADAEPHRMEIPYAYLYYM